MFKIVSEPRAWWPVTWPGVTEDGSEIIENKIQMRFKLLKVDDAVEMVRQANAAEEAARASTEAGDPVKASRIYAAAIAMIAEDWREVLRENGEPLPWSEENLALLMNVPGTFEAVQQGYRDCITGRKAIREGN